MKLGSWDLQLVRADRFKKPDLEAQAALDREKELTQREEMVARRLAAARLTYNHVEDARDALIQAALRANRTVQALPEVPPQPLLAQVVTGITIEPEVPVQGAHDQVPTHEVPFEGAPQQVVNGVLPQEVPQEAPQVVLQQVIQEVAQVAPQVVQLQEAPQVVPQQPVQEAPLQGAAQQGVNGPGLDLNAYLLEDAGQGEFGAQAAGQQAEMLPVYQLLDPHPDAQRAP